MQKELYAKMLTKPFMSYCQISVPIEGDWDVSDIVSYILANRIPHTAMYTVNQLKLNLCMYKEDITVIKLKFGADVYIMIDGERNGQHD